MPTPLSIQMFRVVINKNGYPKRELRHVTSFMEVPDEENETAKALAFYDDTRHWRTFGPADFDRITIEVERGKDRI